MLSFGMPSGFAELLQEKYAQMRLTATAQADSLGAAAGLDRVKTKLLPGQTEAEIGKINAETGMIGEQARQVAPLARGLLGLQSSQARGLDATTEGTGIENNFQRRITRLLGGGGLPGIFSGRSALSGYGMGDE